MRAAMRKKATAILTACILAFGIAGCGDEELEFDEQSVTSAIEDEGQRDDQTQANTVGSIVAGIQSSDQGTSGGLTASSPQSGDDMRRGLDLRMSPDTAELQIQRYDGPVRQDYDKDGIWTIFVYLCGADLESGGGMATGDLQEMLGGTPGNYRFVVETGGASAWNNELVDNRALDRLVIQDQDISKVDSVAAANMGQADTLADFLIWGVENYESEHMGLVLWDHGGGSITGVCFDENYDRQSLDLKAIDQALLTAIERTQRRLDFVGFDACLMGTVETANIVASYADYMIGSQELEPGTGWDYTAIGNYLSKNPGAGMVDLGHRICDSFFEACKKNGEGDGVTLALMDMGAMDDLLITFHDFAHQMYDSGRDVRNRAVMIRGIQASDNFGGNNKSEGYTNMVDMGGIIDACASYADQAQRARTAIGKVVVYAINGAYHKNASGLSMYYPLCIQGSRELSIFGSVCISPYYLSFIDRNSQANLVSSVEEQTYDDSALTGGGAGWTYGIVQNPDYFSYADEVEATGESAYITFEDEPTLDEDGTYWFCLDENGCDNALDVHALVYEISEDEEDLLTIGETTDVYGDWDTGVFTDGFDGNWLSLPDGQNLALYVVEETEDYVVYTCPIYLNGERSNLRIRHIYDGDNIEIEGTWDGIDEEGAAARDVVPLSVGDVIVPIYDAESMESDDEYEYTGQEYTVERDMEIHYDLLAEGDYMYAFCIDDIYGDYYITESVMFHVDENGDISFEEE